MSNLDKKIQELNNLAKNLGNQIDAFNKHKVVSRLYKLCETSLNFFMKFAEVVQLPLEQVILESVFESINQQAFVKEAFEKEIPNFGKVKSVGKTKGTIIFVDITKSSKYFEEKENYTGFVIFNAFILVVNKITEVFGGEFLEHTGDGAFIFFPEEDWNSHLYGDLTYIWVPAMNQFFVKIQDSERYGCNSNPEECVKEIFNPLSAFLLAGEFFKYFSSKENLIRYVGNVLDTIPSLIHIGSSYGEVYKFYIGNVKKLVSKTVWDAANYCKKSPREYKIKWEVFSRKFYIIQMPLLINSGGGKY